MNCMRGVDILGADAAPRVVIQTPSSPAGRPGVAVSEYRTGNDYFTDSETVRAVQQKIMALPQYVNDRALSLVPYGADGKWGPVTASAVRRFNAYYRAGGASDNDGPFITPGTLAALKISTLAAPTGKVGASDRDAADKALAEAELARTNAAKAAAEAVTDPTPAKVRIAKETADTAEVAEKKADAALSPGFWADLKRAPKWQLAVGGAGASAVVLGLGYGLVRLIRGR